MEPDVDRPRGILTEKDRRYLRDGELPDSKQARYERKRGTRERVKNSLLDFHYLVQMDPDERNKLFEGLDKQDVLIPLVQFVYVSLEYDEDSMADLILNATQWAEAFEEFGEIQEEPSYITNVEFESEYSTEVLKEKFDSNENLTDGELSTLARHGHAVGLDYEELEERMKEHYGK